MNVDKNSWHYKFLKFTGYPFRYYEKRDGWNPMDSLDSCQYIRDVSTRLILLFIVGSVFLIVASDFLAWLFAMLFNWSLTPPNFPAFITAIIVSLCISIFGSLACAKALASKGRLFLEKSKVKELGERYRASFVYQAYDRLVNKFCTPVEFTEKK